MRKSLAKYVLVDQNHKVIPIANQDLAGFPLYAGRMVRLTGEVIEGALVAVGPFHELQEKLAPGGSLEEVFLKVTHDENGSAAPGAGQ